MTCSVTIDSASGHAIPGWVVLTVTGTADECAQVSITIRCAHESLGTVVIPVNDGTWSLTAPQQVCYCGGEILVQAQCIDVTSCVATPLSVPTLSCDQPCLHITSIDVSFGDCVEDMDGVWKKQVVFTPFIGGGFPTGHVWYFGEGSPVPGSGAPFPTTYLYQAAPIIPPSLCITGPGPCQMSCLAMPLSAFAEFTGC